MAKGAHRQVKKICCIGAGYVGGPTCAVIASNKPDIAVTVVDQDAERINAWNSNNLPIFEPGMLELVQKTRDSAQPNLFFSTDIDHAIGEADLIFISVNTPTKQSGSGAGRALDLGHLEAAASRIAEVARNDKIIVEKSTVPCRTAETIRQILDAKARPGVKFDILSNPEFMAEGTAIANLQEPDRILIGCLKTPDGYAAASALTHIYSGWVQRIRIITINLWSSELAKLASNALLAQRVSSINSLSAVCEAVDADIEEVSYACGLDSRIGLRMLRASVGFGGSCFKKDILSLCYIAESLGMPEVAAYWKSVIDMNEYQKDRFAQRIVSRFCGTLTDRQIAVLGWTYKKDTSDSRESPAIAIVSKLLSEGAHVCIYDPLAKPDQIRRDLITHNGDATEMLSRVTVYDSELQACADSHAVVVLTEWDAFNDRTKEHEAASSYRNPTDLLRARIIKVRWDLVAKIMRAPRYVFDGRNVIDATKLEELGFRVECIGKPSMFWP